MPIIPLQSYLVLAGGREAIPIQLSWRSIRLAWGRLMLILLICPGWPIGIVALAAVSDRLSSAWALYSPPALLAVFVLTYVLPIFRKPTAVRVEELSSVAARA